MVVLTFTPVAHAQGAHTRHKEAASALLAHRHQVFWIGPAGTDAQKIKGINFVPLRWQRFFRLGFLGYLLSFFTTFWCERKSIPRIDVVFVFREKEALFFPLIKVLNGCGSCVIFQRANILEKLRFQAQHAEKLVAKATWRLRLSFWSYALPILYRFADTVIVQTPRHKVEIDRLVSSVCNIAVLPNAVGASWMCLPAVDIRKILNLPEGKVIGFVGNLYYYVKGLDLLIDAFAQIDIDQAVNLVVIGGGPDKERLEYEVNFKGIRDKVHFLGRLPQASRFMSSFDVLAHCARVDDCPNVVLEGLSANVPIIATRIPAHEFILGNNFIGLTGLSSSDLTKALKEALLNNVFRRQLLTQQSDRVQSFQHDWNEAVVRALEGGQPWFDPGSK